MKTSAAQYPRALTDLERELILRVLPGGSAGYARHREFIAAAAVIGQGRRGEGEIILGDRGDMPDLEAPLPPVFAYGVARSGDEDISVTVREILDGQLSAEIVGRKSDRVAPGSRIDSFWTYSDWRPGNPCPQCGGKPREAVISEDDGGTPGQALGICRADRRLWIFDGGPMTCRPMPVTNYHNELMLLKHIRDPEIALVSAKLFELLDDYSDGDLVNAFRAYNRISAKIDPGGSSPEDSGAVRGIGKRLKKIFLGG